MCLPHSMFSLVSAKVSGRWVRKPGLDPSPKLLALSHETPLFDRDPFQIHQKTLGRKKNVQHFIG